MGSEEDFLSFWSYIGMAAILVLLPQQFLQNLCSLFPTGLYIKFGFDLSLTEKRCLKIMVIYMYIALGQGPDNPLGSIISKTMNLLLIWLFTPRISQ